MFEEAIVHIIKDNEGGYSNHKSDEGGETNYGVSLRFLKTLGLYGDFNNDGCINGNDIKNMDVEEAKALYKEFWWDKHKYHHINSPRIVTKILDMSINLGSYNAHCIIQNSLNDFGEDLIVDGIIGWKTITAINNCKETNKLLSYIIANLSKYYLKLYDRDKKKRVNFIVGWLKRATRRLGWIKKADRR